MGLLDFFRPKNAIEVQYDTSSDSLTKAILRTQAMSPADMWRSQPHLRTVVTFMARNISQLALHTFIMEPDGDRVRERAHPVAQTLKLPNANQTGVELVFSLVSDLALYDNAYWIVGPADRPSGFEIRAIPASWVTGAKGGDAFAPARFIVEPPDGKKTEIAAEKIVHFHGWDPTGQAFGTSPVETLKGVLVEQAEAMVARQQVWKRAGRYANVIVRPKSAGPWSKEAEDKFLKSLRERMSGNGEGAGGDVILQDDMKLEQHKFSAGAEGWVEGSKLSLQTIAQVYQVNPTMVGLLDNANYSNVREFRRMLYGDTLGPIIAMIEERINAFVLPMLDAQPGMFTEFNIGEKLEGSFEEQAAVMQTMVGGPIMTVNEARPKFNLPRMDNDGADQLIVPLNVIQGGQASPRDSAPKALAAGQKAGGPETKADTPTSSVTWSTKALKDDHQEEADDLEAILVKTFKRQQAAVEAAIGAKAAVKADDWWASDRWDRELSKDLLDHSLGATASIAEQTMLDLDLDPADYEPARTEAYLKKGSAAKAKAINTATQTAIQAALDDGEDVADVFATAISKRAPATASTLMTALASFAVTESVKQSDLPDDGPTKTWWVTSPNPRPEHASMHGETVGMDDRFSNGAKWPGDFALGIDGVAGCKCELQVSTGE